MEKCVQRQALKRGVNEIGADQMPNCGGKPTATVMNIQSSVSTLINTSFQRGDRWFLNLGEPFLTVSWSLAFSLFGHCASCENEGDADGSFQFHH
jgi:hypothetical protein